MSFVRALGSVHFAELLEAPRGGAAPGPALLLIHSLATSHRIWDGFIGALGWPGPVLRYDLRGHGLSEVGERPYSIASLQRDASALLDVYGIQSVVACGLSVGGLITQELALGEPRVRAAVLCGTASRIGTVEGWQSRISQVRAGGVASVSEAVLQRWFGAPFHASHPDVVRGYRCLLERTPADGYVAMLEALAAADLTARLGSLRVPTLVVSGELDEATPPAEGRALAARIPGARFELLAGASHLLNVEKPRELAALVRVFLEGLALG
jgi:3-oxoadipate enol-lactonase